MPKLIAAGTRIGIKISIAASASIQRIELRCFLLCYRSRRASSSAPELARGDARAFGHRRHLRPHDVRIDGRLPDPGAEAAVAPGHDVLAADELRVTPDPLRGGIGGLDEV